MAAALLCAATPATAPSTGPQGVQASEIELARIAMDQPGADHRLERENAVKTLLNLTDQRAHIILQDRLRGGDDTDKVSLFILEELGRQISNPTNEVFGIPNGESGSMLLKSYVPALVSAFIEEDPDERHRRLREPSLQCLLHMQPRARLEGLRAILAPGIQDVEMQRAALRAAASCRETGLAGLLGEQLRNSSLSDVARQGLKQLTFEDFSDGDDFDRWWADHSDSTYLELVETVAMSADAVQAEQDQKLIQLQVRLMEALVGQASVKWRDIHELVLADEPTGALSESLTRLREILRSKNHDGNATDARLEFHTALLLRLAGAELEEKVLLLEIAAYLIRPQEDRERAAMEAMLIDHLGSPYPSLRLAALRSLQRFPSPANRAAVVRVAKDSLAGTGVDELSTLQMALTALSEPGWNAPGADDADHPDWIQVLRQVLARTDAPELLNEGLEVAFRPDESGGHPEQVFGLLMKLALDADTEINQRVRVLLQIGEFVTSENSGTYLASVLNLLDDDRFQIRRQAAELLSQLPESRDIYNTEEWLLEVRQKVAARLPREPREGVFQALVTCLNGLSRNEPENVIAIFKNALETLPEEQVRHREIVIEALTRLGLRTELEVAQWQVAADTLLDNNHRDRALEILNKHNAGELSGTATPEDAQRGLELLVRAAMLKPAVQLHSSEEAQDVLAAFAKLETDFAVTLNDPAHQLLRLQLHDVLENNGDLIELGAAFLLDAPAQKDQVLILMARASLREGDPIEARMTMERLSEAGSKTTPALAVCHQIGKSLMAQDADEARSTAVDVLTKVVDDTRQESDRYRERFLDLAEATLLADPDKRAEVTQMLNSKRPLFEAVDCPPAERERFQKLLEAAGA